MESKRRSKNVVLPAVLAAALLLALAVGGVFFTGYLEARIFQERTTQLVEITTQVGANLRSALDTHWN